jgi:hypothetical protein
MDKCTLTFLNSVVKHPVGLRPAMLGFLRIFSKAKSGGAVLLIGAGNAEWNFSFYFFFPC